MITGQPTANRRLPSGCHSGVSATGPRGSRTTGTPLNASESHVALAIKAVTSFRCASCLTLAKHPGIMGTRGRWMVAPYLKALRRSSVQLCAGCSSVGTELFRAAWQHGPMIITFIPDIADPFRRNHIFASQRHDGHLGGCRNQRSSVRALMEPPR